MQILTPAQAEDFWRDGYLVAAGAVTAPHLDRLRDQLQGWVDESRGHAGNWGETYDKLPRFDLEDGHAADSPRLRRVNNPVEVSDVFFEATFESPMRDMVADLIGPNVKFHHSKINIKLPHTESRVGLHQDFSYTPHTNNDIVTALLLLDDMTDDNGPLMAVPGSHREGQKSLWQDGAFTGRIAADEGRELQDRLVPITGKAGDVCLMHTSLVHGSEPNRSDARRTLYISVYTAADAFPLHRSPLPNKYEGRIVAGQETRVARLSAGAVELPADFREASFFHLSGQGTN